jgi:hypothetical protein
MGVPAAVTAAVALVGVGLAFLVINFWDVGKPPNPDPGNRRLDALAADPFVTQLPPGATTISFVRRPVHYDPPGIGGGRSWHGPAVTIDFTTTVPADRIYAFYEAQAKALGWTTGAGLNGRGYPIGWTKTAPAGDQWVVRLSGLSPSAASQGDAIEYELNASA